VSTGLHKRQQVRQKTRVPHPHASWAATHLCKPRVICFGVLQLLRYASKRLGEALARSMCHKELIPQCIQCNAVLVLLPSMAGTPRSHAVLNAKPNTYSYVLELVVLWVLLVEGLQVGGCWMHSNRTAVVCSY
jgi:hypothetical protein